MNMKHGKVRNYIPHDLALCILSKLPVKSLMRFGCVRKSWTLLFENQHFMNIFRNNFISNHHSYYDDTSIILESSNGDFYSLSGDKCENMVKLNFQNPFQEEVYPFVYVLDSGSITGILCVYQYHNGKTVFWNPTLEEFKIIPPSPFLFRSPYQHFVVNPLGFGYDIVRDDYKLIRCVGYFDLEHEECEELGISWSDVPRKDLSYEYLWEIYSLKSNTWRKLDVNDSACSCFSNIAGVRLYMNEMYHWWQYGKTHDEVEVESFDLRNEVFFTTHVPLLGDIHSTSLYMVGLNGSIAFISWTSGIPTFDISILGEIGVKESWITKLYSIGPFSCIEHPIPIGTWKNGFVFFRTKDNEIVLYDLQSQMIEELCIEGENFSHILPYKKNLLSIGGINQ